MSRLLFVVTEDWCFVSHRMTLAVAVAGAGVRARFLLAGASDAGNPTAVPEASLRDWHGENVVEWLGQVDDMAALYRSAHIACLPSYREGLPKSLIEAAACGLPIVTTDTPGCREVVRHGENGLLVPVKNAAALAAALRSLIEDAAMRQRMGVASRKRAETEFSAERIIAQTLDVYRKAAT